MTNLNISPDEANLIKSVSEYGLFLQIVTIIIDFAIKKDKKAALSTLRNFLEVFNNSLTEEEKLEYRKKVDDFLLSKGQAFKNELSKEFSKEEVNKIFQLMAK